MTEALIKSITNLAAFEPAIKLQEIDADLNNRYFKDYILTQDLANVYKKILESVVGNEIGISFKSHLISAQYGTGKSYFLMILSAILNSANDTRKLEVVKSKFKTFSEVSSTIGKLTDKRFLIIQISAEDKGDLRFNELLVRSLLNQVEKILPDTVFTNEYTEALDHLDELEKSQIGLDFFQAFEEKFEMNLQQLRAGLSSYDRSTLRIYYQACERILGREVSRDELDLGTTFQEGLEKLKSKGFTHVAVLIDELTAYLKASAGHHPLAETLGQMQSFAAYCNKASNHCLFVGTMHVSVQEFLQDLSQQKDYDKMKGRFEEHPFPLYSNKLLAGVFKPNEIAFENAMLNYRQEKKKLDDLLETLKMLNEDCSPLKLSAFFPLHPASAHYLPRISRELGQAERTSFGFLNDLVRTKLNEPIGKNGKLNLVTMDQVFDYFLPAMEQREYYLQVISALNIVTAKAPNPISIKSFKILALLWVASRVRLTAGEIQYLDVDLSADQIANYINETDYVGVINALGLLCETGFVYCDGSTKRYFYSHSDPGWDLESEIQKGMASVDANQVLQGEIKVIGQRVCLNIAENISVKVDRTLEQRQINVQQLKSSASFAPKRAEGLVVFVVPEISELDTYEVSHDDIILKARQLSSTNVVVAVPKKVDMLNQNELKRYGALIQIGKKLGGIEGQASMMEHRTRLAKVKFDEVHGRVQSDIEEFGNTSNFTFFLDHQPTDAHDINTVLVNLFEHHYHKFPIIKVERINGRGTTNALIDTCIVNPQYTFATDTQEVARQARDMLQCLGLCKWERGAGGKFEVELKEPEPGTDGYEIWKTATDILTSEDNNTPFNSLYRKLMQTPYGLPDYMVELYIAAEIALKKFYVLDPTGKMPPVSKNLVQAITKKGDKDYRIIQVQKTEVSYFYICSLWQSIDDSLGLSHYKSLEKNLGKAIDDQKIWMELKPDCNNLLQNKLSRIKEHIEVIGVESKPFQTLLDYLNKAKSEIMASKGFNVLALLGGELSGEKIGKDADKATFAFRNIIQAADQFLVDWPKIQIICKLTKILEKADQLEAFGKSGEYLKQAWTDFGVDALSQEKCMQLIEKFNAYWSEYFPKYVDEHNIVSRIRKNFGLNFQKSLPYKIIGEFRSFEFKGIATCDSFDQKINMIRRESCQPLSEESMAKYQQFGGISCSYCEYSLGSSALLLTSIQEEEEKLEVSLKNTLEVYFKRAFDLFQSDNGSIRKYTLEKADSTEKAVLNQIATILRPYPPTDSQLEILLELFSKFRQIEQKASTYIKEEARTKEQLQKQMAEEERKKNLPRISTGRINESFITFIQNCGLEELTLDDLQDQLRRWFLDVSKELKPK